MDFPLWIRVVNLVLYHGSVFLICRWLYKYWYLFRFTDEEDLSSVRQMKRLLMLWVAALLVNWIYVFGEIFL